MGWIPTWSSLWLPFPSVFVPLFVSIFLLDRNISGLTILRWVGGPIPQMGAMSIYWRWSLQVLSLLCWVFQLKSSLLGPGNVSLLGLYSGYPQFPISHCYTPLFNFLTLCTFSQSPPTSDPIPPFPSTSFLTPNSLPPSSSSHFVLPSK